jgi:hypothetical protein
MKLRLSRLSLAHLIHSLSALKPWQLWLVLVLLPGGPALWALTHLIGLPALPNCHSQADASTANRLYCAQLLALHQNPEDLQQAIHLANRISGSDPQRPESDRLIDQWSNDLLRLGEQAFQAGDLDKAIEIAHRMPRSLRVWSRAEQQIKQWRTIWQKAERIYEEAEDQLSQRDWYGVMQTARGLLELDNRYWQGRYEELLRTLHADKTGSELPVESVVRAKPPVTPIAERQAERAQRQLEQARSLAESGSIEDLQAAIAEAEEIGFGTPQYEAAQTEIETWRDRIATLEDQPLLDRARKLAAQADSDALETAIETANDITWGSPLYEDARAEIEQWRDQLYELEVNARTEALDRLTTAERSGDREDSDDTLPESMNNEVPKKAKAPFEDESDNLFLLPEPQEQEIESDPVESSVSYPQ